jgi:vanillate O-demethylase ferredoxin subunit
VTEYALRTVIVAKSTGEVRNIVSFELIDPTGAELATFSGSHVEATSPATRGTP